ncbi:172_t:CDS:2 [Ambispora gerdemannii]|uniref:172_t:CDS:1 n=1 Tax=Ambispora gerdemannii TaxID=144530 RepID=A0A9N9DEF1_9GLOM|nr:172_t:CDS:2 [Ambispora gerdemannii]
MSTESIALGTPIFALSNPMMSHAIPMKNTDIFTLLENSSETSLISVNSLSNNSFNTPAVKTGPLFSHKPRVEIKVDLPSDDENDDDLSSPVLVARRQAEIEAISQVETDADESHIEENLTNRKEPNHMIMKHIWKSNYSAPIKMQLFEGGLKVLDVGCGTGIWLDEMAAENPRSTFTGMDVNSSLFKLENKNGNAGFFVYNLLDGLPFGDNTFDYIHQSFLNLYLTEKQWKETVIKELVRVCKPGGYIELIESDLQYINAGETTHNLNRSFRSAYKRRGINPVMCGHLIRLLEETNVMTNVTIEERHIPLGSRKGSISKMATEGIIKSLYSARNVLSRLMKITPEEYDKLCKTIGEEYDENKTKIPTCRILGQKISDNHAI